MVGKSLQLNQIREYFLKVNSQRIDRTKKLMSSKTRDLLDVIPLLFQINHSLLPGYSGEETPQGVFSYVPADTVIAHAKTLWRGFSIQRRGTWAADIDSLFLMGSCGSIAFNRKSDFDIWLCYRSGLPEDRLDKLQEKANSIERWFDSVGLEVHFFLMNAETFREGQVNKLSTESSGSAQYHLLLDEFYRSSIWLAGKLPFWWYVSPDKEDDYEAIKAQLISEELIAENEVIDFGTLANIPASEYFGAAVWQIYKGVDSPYKSVLKITLMEGYADRYPDAVPLSKEFKIKVFNAITDPEKLDPYLLMLNRIEEHLNSDDEKPRLEVVRRSFYLKLNLPLSKDREKESWRRSDIEALVKSWGWDKNKIRYLDEKSNWKVEDVMEERKLLVMHLTKSYAFLSNFARIFAKKRLINQKDLSVLGRKLYSVFDRKPGKVEIFNRGIVDSLTEDNVTIILLHGKDKREYWRLYRGKVTGTKFKESKPLKQSNGLIDLVAWIHFNQLMTKATQKLLYAPGSDVTNTELNTILDKFDEMSEKVNVFQLESKELLKPAYVLNSIVFLNIGKTPLNVPPHISKQIISGDVDILSHSTDSECMVQSIEYFYITSWKEVFVQKYYNADGLMDWLCDFLDIHQAAAKYEKEAVKVLPEVISFDSQTVHMFSKRLNKLCQSVLKIFIASENTSNRFVVEIAKSIYCISYREGQFVYDKYSQISELIDELSKPVVRYQATYFDKNLLTSTPLPIIFRMNKIGVVQMFCLKEKDHIAVYVLDEMGVLFHQKMPMEAIEKVVFHFALFFATTIDRRALMQDQEINSELSTELLQYNIEFHKLVRQGYSYSSKKIPVPDTNTVQRYGVQVIGDVENKKAVFTFYCDEEEINSADWGSKIFAHVAEQIVKKRNGKSKYYIYITDMELSPALVGKKNSYVVQTSELLKYKKRIEDSLNIALKRLSMAD